MTAPSLNMAFKTYCRFKIKTVFCSLWVGPEILTAVIKKSSIRPWRWRWYVNSKPQGITFQKIILFSTFHIHCYENLKSNGTWFLAEQTSDIGPPEPLLICQHRTAQIMYNAINVSLRLETEERVSFSNFIPSSLSTLSHLKLKRPHTTHSTATGPVPVFTHSSASFSA
jgi:hypothetical protein